LNSVTRAYYEHMAQVEPSQRAADILAMLRTPPDMDAVQRLSRDPMDNARLHTTCVATRLQAGHANNALPARAEAVVNCRILPGHTKQEVRADLGEVFDDPQLQIRYIADDHDASDTVPEQHPFAPPPPNPEVFHAAQTVAAKIWPGTPLFPTMANGASDAVHTMAVGLPTYGVSGIEAERNDHREHGTDERVPVASFFRGVQFYYDFLKVLTSGSR